MIIGFAGKMGVGKTTICKLLMQAMERSQILCEDQMRRVAFGDALKFEVSQLYDFPLSWIYEERKDAKITLPPDLPKKYISPSWEGEPTIRQILQFYATEVRRAQDLDCWVKLLDAKIQGLYDGGVRLILIDDVRFPNEHKYVRSRGVCYLIQPYPEYQVDPAVGGHSSETSLDPLEFDGVFWPKYGEADLWRMALQFSKRLAGLYRIYDFWSFWSK